MGRTSRMLRRSLWLALAIVLVSGGGVLRGQGDMGQWGLDGIVYSYGLRASLFGENVYLPTPEGFVPYRSAVGESCPSPRYSSPGITAAGWFSTPAPPLDPFMHCGANVKELLFYLFPSDRASHLSMPVVSEEMYVAWGNDLERDSARPEFVAHLVASASARWLGGSSDSIRLGPAAGGLNDGFPFVAGSFEVELEDDQRRKFYFATSVTLVGSTWCMPVLVKAEGQTDGLGETALSLAKGTYRLNRGYVGSPRLTKNKKEGPWSNFEKMTK